MSIEFPFNVMIEEQEIIPIRRIPTITGDSFGPGQVVNMLAQRNKWCFPCDLTRNGDSLRIVSYDRRNHERKPRPRLPHSWDTLLNIVDETLTQFEQSNGLISEWNREIVRKLPAGVFVYRVDFEKIFSQVNHPDRVSIINERPGEREIDILSISNTESLDFEFEGFEDLSPVAPPTIDTVPAPEIDTGCAVIDPGPGIIPKSHYTFEEAAEILCLSAEEIFQRMINGEACLFPAICFKNPVNMTQCTTTMNSDGWETGGTDITCTGKGLFDIRGIHLKERWTANSSDPYGLFSLKYLPNTRNHGYCLLFQEGKIYYISENKTIPKSRLVLSPGVLQQYAETIGLDLDWPKEERSGCDRAGTPEESDFVKYKDLPKNTTEEEKKQWLKNASVEFEKLRRTGIDEKELCTIFAKDWGIPTGYIYRMLKRDDSIKWVTAQRYFGRFVYGK